MAQAFLRKLRQLTQPKDAPRMAGGGLTVRKSALYIFMILMVAFTALPLIYVVSSAFKPMEELFLFPPRFFVQHPTTRNFSDLIMSLGSSTIHFLRYVFNSVVISVAVVLLTVLVCSMGAYALSKHRVPASGVIFKIIIAALMFSPHVTTIPRYLVVNALGLYDTYTSLVITQIAVAYNFFLMKQFIDQFPNEILESGRIDGAGEWTLFRKIVMPSQKPAVATLVVLTFVSCWNDYFTPLIYTSSQKMKTLPLALQTIAGGAAAVNVGRAGAVAAATLLMILPVVVLFTVMQGQVMATMTHSGIKG